jgi:hypothetical protein
MHFPEGVCRVNIGDFRDCTELASLYIPASATDFGDAVFWLCNGITSITVSPDNPKYSSKDGILFDKEGTMLATFPAGREGAYSIPDCVTEIANSAFSNCAKLASVTIPDSVTEIGYRAFESCKGLTSVHIPGSVAEIGEGVFGYCERLTSITVAPDNPAYSSKDGILFDKTGTELLAFPAGRQGEYAIPAGVTKFG